MNTVEGTPLSIETKTGLVQIRNLHNLADGEVDGGCQDEGEGRDLGVDSRRDLGKDLASAIALLLIADEKGL